MSTTATGLPMVALPHAPRGQVFAALLNLLKNTPAPLGFKQWNTFTQHPKSWDDIPGANQPALLLERGPQIAEQKSAFGVTKWQWRAFIWIYYRIDSLQCAGDNDFPEQILDSILDGLEQVLQTDPLNGRLTLGGLIWHCWIDGSCVFDPGLIDNQAVVVVPISILI